MGDKLYFIESGAVSVERKAEKERLPQLGPGEFFGEIALVHNVPRTATVSCVEKSTLLTLGQEDFQSVIASDFAAAMRLERVADERVGGGSQ